MSEEEITKILQELIDMVKEYGFDYTVEEAVVINKNEYNAIQGLLDLYNKEKEKNTELQNYMKEYLIPKSTINLLYISKDKIREKIKEYDGLKEMDMQAYEEQIRPLKELLEEE